MLAVQLLGPLTITLNGQPITNFVSRKAEALLAFLAFTRTVHPRETVAELLWDERTTSQAQSNLRVVLSNLRKLLGDYMDVTRHTVSLNFALPMKVDTATLYEIATPIVERLERHSMNPSRMGVEGVSAAEVEALQETLTLYSDHFLAGLFLTEAAGFEEWLLRERGHLETFVIRAYDALLTAQLNRRAYPAAIGNANRLLALVPWHERAYQALMLAHARMGDLTSALAVYQRCQHILEEELAAPPSAPTTRLYLRIRAARTAPHRPLPVAPGLLVGREEEVQEVIELLQLPTNRLVTLSGMGGVGKTRIAMEVATALHHSGEFLHGVHFLRLEAITPHQLPATLASAIGITLQSNRPAPEQIATALQDKEMLLVLDNMETLLNTETERDVQQWLSSWIRGAPDVKWLITTQTQVRLREEIVVDVEGLPYPTPTPLKPFDPNTLDSYSAITLFLENATRYRRKYTPTAEWEAVVRLTQLVEGLPLALEIAGASMRGQSCTALVAALEQNLDELRSPHADVPDRHLGMRAIFVHAWSALSENEQTVLARLAFLRGAFSLDAATTIAYSTPLFITQLISKSMVRYDQDAALPYALHSLTRAFAFEHLSATPDLLQDTAERHATYYTRRLAAHHTALLTEWTDAHESLMDEMDSIHTALLWIIDHQRWQDLAPAIEAAFLFFLYGAMFHEGEQVFARADAVLAEESDPRWRDLQLRVRVRRIAFYLELERNHEAQALLQPTLADLEAENHAELLAAILVLKSRLAVAHGQYELAEQTAERAVAIGEPVQDTYTLSFAYRLLAIAAERRGNFERAEAHSRHALALVSRLGSHTPNFLTLRVTLANILQGMDQVTEAEAIYREALAIAEQLEIPHAIAVIQSNLGFVLWKQGEFHTARTILMESIAIKQVIGNPVGLAISKINLGEVYTGLEQYDQAHHNFHQAVVLTRDSNNVPMLLEAIMGIAALWRAQGESKKAREWLQMVAHHPQTKAESRTRAKQLLNHSNHSPLSTIAEETVETIAERVLAQLEM